MENHGGTPALSEAEGAFTASGRRGAISQRGLTYFNKDKHPFTNHEHLVYFFGTTIATGVIFHRGEL
ncbi:MAG TPA: hypothetical protein PKM44_03070 [Turneriella sp.]|nr:hypothetical protein [Turneriella sp.]HNE20179.1 hypothetical protein [Turneriella sp.]HNL09467.1 hypothetical protein [Turneriella sp.]HNM99299.1 hypothetical protein [Turneriella sp.]